MADTVEVPATLLRSLIRASEALAELEDELEDYLLSNDPELLARMREARSAHLAGDARPIEELKKELCID